MQKPSKRNLILAHRELDILLRKPDAAITNPFRVRLLRSRMYFHLFHLYMQGRITVSEDRINNRPKQ